MEKEIVLNFSEHYYNNNIFISNIFWLIFQKHPHTFTVCPPASANNLTLAHLLHVASWTVT